MLFTFNVFAQDVPAPYQAVIQRYIDGLNNRNAYNMNELGDFGGGDFFQAGLGRLGYNISDLNSDGTPELFVGQTSGSYFAAIYTIENNSAKKLVTQRGSDTFTSVLSSVPGHSDYSNCISTWGAWASGGAIYYIYRLNGTNLSRIASTQDYNLYGRYHRTLSMTPFSSYNPVNRGPAGSIYRLFNRTTGEHLYTPDYNEASTISRRGWTSEGVGWNAPTSGTPVYRLFNPDISDHLYTTDTNEVRVLTSRGWRTDNGGRPLFYSGGGVSIYRLYNPTTKRHHLTKDLNEYNVLPGRGWRQEGAKLRCNS